MTGSEDVEVANEDVLEKGESVTEISIPPSCIFNPVGRSVAKKISVGNEGRELFLGKVDAIIPVPVRNSDRILVQAWKVVWDDGDEEEMEC